MPLAFEGGTRCYAEVVGWRRHLCGSESEVLATPLCRLCSWSSCSCLCWWPIWLDVSDCVGLRAGERVRGYDVMGLLVVWMLATTRRGAGVFFGFVRESYRAAERLGACMFLNLCPHESPDFQLLKMQR